MSAKSANKLKQRAELLSILGKYRNNTNVDNKQLKNDIDIINTYDDKTFVCKTLFQEITDTKSYYANTCAIMILETIENNILEKESLKLLEDNKVSDDKKFFIISIMKQKGIDFDTNNISKYIQIPENVAHEGIIDFLNNALEDPEVQIDLLDFFVNIPKEEKVYFLENVCNDFDGDHLGNAFSLLSQLETNKEETQVILMGLFKSNSPFAIEGLNHILKNKPVDTKIKSKIRRTIKKITTENPNFSNNSIIKDTKIFKTYISFVDGCSNFSLVISRKREENSTDAFLCTINMQRGIISCMGFGNITHENLTSIIKRLFNDSSPIDINPIALKSLFEHYYQKTLSNKLEVPYELIVWKKLLNDIRTINFDISEFLNSKLEVVKLTEQKTKKLSCATIMETWYYSVGQNEYVDEIIKTIEKKHITDLDQINKITEKSVVENFLKNKEVKSEIQSRLLLQSYVASLAKLKSTSACTYTLCFYPKLLKIFINSSIDKSLYYYFSTKLYELEEDNQFKKINPTSFSKEELELIMSQLEEKWN